MRNQETTIRRYELSLLFSVIATAYGSGLMGIILTNVVNEYSLAAHQSGYMSSAISAGALIALLMANMARGRFGKPTFIIFGGMLMSAMLFLQSMSISFRTLLAVCFFMGIGIGIMDSNQSSFLADLDETHRKCNLGMLHGIFGLSGVFLPLIIHRMLTVMSWHAVALAGGLIGLSCVGQFALYTRAKRGCVPAASRLEQSDNRERLMQYIRTPFFNVLHICMFIGAAAQNGIIVWTVRYVGAYLSAPEHAALCLSVFWLASTVSRLCSPMLPVPPLQLLAVGSCAAGAAWIIGVCSGNTLLLIAMSGLVGLLSGCCIPVLLSEAAEFGREDTGLITNTMMTVKTCGQILCPLLISSVIGSQGMTAAMCLICPLFAADGASAWALNVIKGKDALNKKEEKS